MDTLIDIVIVLLILLLPRFVIVAADKYALCKALGPVFICYTLGFLLSFVLPQTGVAMSFSEILVPVAIPLILFSANLSALEKLAKPMLTSMVLCIVAVSALAAAAFFVFRDAVESAADIGGMLTGLYTGGTPNLIAIGMALGVNEETIIIVNTADLIAGGVYFMLLISVLPRLYRHFLRPFRSLEGPTIEQAVGESLQKEFIPEKEPFSFRMVFQRMAMVVLAVACLGVSAGVAYFIKGNLDVAIVMLGVTTCGVALSFVKQVREMPGSFATGQYLILMFSFAIGLSFDLSAIDRGSMMVLVMLLFVQFGTVVLHAILAKIFRIDRDTTLITSTASVFGPAFIIPVAEALRNKEVILPGLLCGIIGYAVGNYLGIFVAWVLGLL